MSKTVIQNAIEFCERNMSVEVGEGAIYNMALRNIKSHLQSLLPEEKKQMEPNAEMKALLETIVSIRAGMSEYYRQHNYRELYAMYNQLDEQAQQLLNKLNT